MLSARIARHDRASDLLTVLGDDQLTALLETAAPGSVGAGGSTCVVDLDGVPLFVKRIPLTDRERDDARSTANLFDLPLTCHYGMHRLASPGFGSWRELAANLSVTAAVLNGQSEAFAMLHHWRVLPGRPPLAPEHQRFEAVLRQFGHDAAVHSRLAELADASASLVLFFEHLPDRFPEWLEDPAGRAEVVERQLFEIVDVLRRRDLLHMDGHFGNMRADADVIHLVDFGLALSSQFDLSPAEKAFFLRHRDHDADYASMRLVNWLVSKTCGISTSSAEGLLARDELVRRCAAGDIPRHLPSPLPRILRRHASAAATMNAFHRRLVDGDLSARYPGPSPSMPSA